MYIKWAEFTMAETMASKRKRRSRKRRRRHDQETQSLEPNYQEDLKNAFTTGNKEMAEQLLHDVGSTRQLSLLTDVRSNDTFLIASVVYIRSSIFYIRGEMMVSLLHLAAYWGWYDIAVRLVTVHQCSAECKDKEGHIPLHYAARSGHLELFHHCTEV